MSKRAFAYVVAALLLVAGLVVAVVIVSAPEPVAEPEPPKPVKLSWSDGTGLDLADPQGKLVWAQAKRELAEVGISDQDLDKGYTIELTVDPKVQAMARRALSAARTGQPANLRTALVSVDPKSGRIVAYHGHQPEKSDFDFAAGWYNPGSTFMPFGLVALLHEGKRGLDASYDGGSGRKFGKVTINNSEGQCGQQCTVAEAMKNSVHTVFADIAFTEVGTAAVAVAAVAAGIPEKVGREGFPLAGEAGTAPELNIALGGGRYVVRPFDLAGAYATFASNGLRTEPHLVATVKDGDKLIYDGDAAAGPKPAFDTDATKNAKVARTVTESLLPAGLPCAENRPCASKPGVHGCAAVVDKTNKDDTCAAWMVGYTPQLSTAVWVGSEDNTALKDNTGAAVNGKSLPGTAWQTFMNEYHAGKPVEQFPPLN